MLRGLYVITDEKLTPYENIEEYIESTLRGGARVVQFRDKSSSEEVLIKTSLKIKKLCKKYGRVFIINDNIELAKEIDADGVHIGMDDNSLEEAKKILKDKIIGISCYGDVMRAIEMEARGANYVAFGTFFASKTKPNAKVISKSILIEAKKQLNVPICAIGGIEINSARELVNLGSDMLAIISDVWTNRDIENISMEYKKVFDNL